MGREDELKDLEDLLARSGRVALIAAATGMGGIGKTQLAWQYAENHKNLYPGGIWWLRAESFGQQVFSYGQRMGLPTPPEITQEAEQMQWFYGQWLLQIPVGERLLVVDDVQDYGKLKPLLPSDQRFRVLLTTRERIADEIVQRLDIETLKPLDAYELFYKQINLRLGEKVDPRLEREQRQAEELCDWLGYLPLGIKVVAAFLAVEPDLSFAQMQQRLEAEKIKNESLSPIEAAFEISWEKFSPPERQLAGLLSIFATAPIPWNLVTQSLDRCEVKPVKLGLWQRIITKPQRLLTKPQPLQQWCLLLNPKQQEKARRRLVELNCLTYVGEEGYEVHSLLHKFYGEKLGTELGDRAETLQRSFAETLTAVAKTIGQYLTQGDIPRITETLPHLEMVANNFTYLLADDNKTWSCEGLARVAQFQSRWQDVERWRKKSLETSETHLGADHPLTATSLNNLAYLYKSMGRYSDAEPLYERSLHIWETQLGADHPHTAQSLNNLAQLYQDIGRYSDAEPLLMRSLHIWETQLGADHPHTAQSLNNLAGLYYAMRRYSDVEPLYERSLHIWETQLGADHPHTATSLNNLAELYRAMGRYSEAEPLYERSLHIRETQLGADHPDTAGSLNNLAGLYYAMGRYSDAEPLYLRTLEIFLNCLGEDHPNTQTAWDSFRYLLEQALAHGSADSLSPHPLTQQLLQEIKEAML